MRPPFELGIHPDEGVDRLIRDFYAFRKRSSAISAAAPAMGSVEAARRNSHCVDATRPASTIEYRSVEITSGSAWNYSQWLVARACNPARSVNPIQRLWARLDSDLHAIARKHVGRGAPGQGLPQWR